MDFCRIFALHITMVQLVPGNLSFLLQLTSDFYKNEFKIRFKKEVKIRIKKMYSDQNKALNCVRLGGQGLVTECPLSLKNKACPLSGTTSTLLLNSDRRVGLKISILFETY